MKKWYSSQDLNRRDTIEFLNRLDDIGITPDNVKVVGIYDMYYTVFYYSEFKI